jgi:hypothetical protein
MVVCSQGCDEFDFLLEAWRGCAGNVLTAFCAAAAAKEASFSHVLFQHPSVGNVEFTRLLHATPEPMITQN